MNILFVCTGNTCRSPMAEALLRHLGEKEGIAVACDSAGVSAFPGAPMTAPAEFVLREHFGIPDFHHLAKPVSREMLEKADLVIAMTEDHKRLLIQKFGFAPKVISIPGGIGDPFGGDNARYLQTANAIVAGLEELIRQGRIHD